MSDRVLGLAGRARSGKSTLARYLVEDHGWTAVCFADPLREMALDLDPLMHGRKGGTVRLAAVVDEIGWEQAKDQYPEVRRTLQRLGSAARDHLGADVWVDRLVRKVHGIDGPIVVPDVRYPNEVEAIRAVWESSMVIRVVRPAPHSTGLTDTAVDHESETALGGYPFVKTIMNDGPLSDLKDLALRVDSFL